METTLTSSSTPDDDFLMVGRIVAAQGLEGELRVLPMSDFPERFTSPGPRWLRRPREAARPVHLAGGRQLPGKSLFVVRIDGIRGRTAAEALVGEQFLVKSCDRPRLGPGEYHLLDLVGLEVRLLNDRKPTGRDAGNVIGTVRNLLSAGNDLLEVELGTEKEGRRILIPFVKEIVPEVQPEEGWIGITPPAGLLDL